MTIAGFSSHAYVARADFQLCAKGTQHRQQPHSSEQRDQWYPQCSSFHVAARRGVPTLSKNRLARTRESEHPEQNLSSKHDMAIDVIACIPSNGEEQGPIVRYANRKPRSRETRGILNALHFMRPRPVRCTPARLPCMRRERAPCWNDDDCETPVHSPRATVLHHLYLSRG